MSRGVGEKAERALPLPVGEGPRSDAAEGRPVRPCSMPLCEREATPGKKLCWPCWAKMRDLRERRTRCDYCGGWAVLVRLLPVQGAQRQLCMGCGLRLERTVAFARNLHAPTALAVIEEQYAGEPFEFPRGHWRRKTRWLRDQIRRRPWRKME